MPGGEARTSLTAGDVRAMVTTFRDLLRGHREAINRLNVYPVPDGDTGTNMTLTMDSVVAELEAAPDDMAATCKAIGHGALMGGRGNSGVILSQILRAVTARCAGGERVGAADAAEALQAAAEGAYAAVSRPVEGTILTVVRESASGAAAALAAGADLLGVLDGARIAGGEALAHTPEQLPVLAAAGVVDAGGAGFLLLLDAALHVVDGRALPVPDVVAAVPAPLAARPSAPGSPDGPRYEVMYLLEADDGAVARFREAWAALGDSIVVVGGDGLWNCHVHTDDVGAAVEAGIEAGRPRAIRVSDLRDEVEEERWVREAAVPPAASGGDEPVDPVEPVTCAVVAVAAGDGVGRILRSLGAQRVVAGGQSMNPSVAQLLEAVDAAPADEVVVLPNNKNIVPVARQAAELSRKHVAVVASRGLAEGFAAMVAYDPAAGAEANAAAMAEAAGGVVAGEVTRAVRASSCDLGPIAEGDYLGLAGDGIRAVEPTLAGATTALLAALLGDGHELVTVVEGEGATPEATARVIAWLAEQHPEVAVDVHAGGQPLYPYVLGIE
jgi:DAK2 domain fusion protein YloV